MLIFKRTDDFASWLRDLRDPLARASITSRLDRAREGNFGDVEPIGAGISEMRIHVGAGYRVYFSRAGDVVYVLLCGGNKKTQRRDVKHAIELWDEIKGSTPK